MPKPKYAGVHVETTRHGKRAYYFRRGRGLRVRLPDSYGSEEFAAAHARVAAGHDLDYQPPARSTIASRQRQSVERALLAALKGAQQRSRAKGAAFDLDAGWVLHQAEAQRFRCALTGIPFYMEHSAASKCHPFAASIDRISAQGGYTKDNVRIVVYAINVMLLDWGHLIFERVANGYRSQKGTKNKLLYPHRRGVLARTQTKNQ